MHGDIDLPPCDNTIVACLVMVLSLGDGRGTNARGSVRAAGCLEPISVFIEEGEEEGEEEEGEEEEGEDVVFAAAASSARFFAFRARIRDMTSFAVLDFAFSSALSRAACSLASMMC